jgi:hypothetical protein
LVAESGGSFDEESLIIRFGRGMVHSVLSIFYTTVQEIEQRLRGFMYQIVAGNYPAAVHSQDLRTLTIHSTVRGVFNHKLAHIDQLGF